MAEPFLSLKNISKHYVGVTALDHVDFEIDKGEIHCLVGENGSGKSTLIKIISGNVTPDDGAQIEVEGQPQASVRALDAIHHGIEVIYQDLSLFPNLTVTENIAINQYVAQNRRLINWKELRATAEAAAARIGVSLPLDELVADISIADQQLVAICRALTRDVKLLIMDEPTASLTRKEVNSLLEIVDEMRARGIATLFVSHKLDEVLQVADRVTVLRDARVVGTFSGKDLDDAKLTMLMTGKKVEYQPYVPLTRADEAILEVRRLSKEGNYRDINFKLHPGEILGITGLLGSGRTELALSLFGVTQPDSGEICFAGKPVHMRSIQDAVRLGIAYVPENRLIQGLIMNQSVGNNVTITILDQLLNRFHLLDAHKVTGSINEWVKHLSIKVPSVESPVQTLSGGNQQRVVLAKWIATDPKVLILDGPTIGIDVAAKYAIHEIVRNLAQRGIAIILISEEVPEVFQNCNRVIVMHKGRFVSEFETARSSLEAIQDCVNQGL